MSKTDPKLALTTQSLLFVTDAWLSASPELVAFRNSGIPKLLCCWMIVHYSTSQLREANFAQDITFEMASSYSPSSVFTWQPRRPMRQDIMSASATQSTQDNSDASQQLPPHQRGQYSVYGAKRLNDEPACFSSQQAQQHNQQQVSRSQFPEQRSTYQRQGHSMRTDATRHDTQEDFARIQAQFTLSQQRTEQGFETIEARFQTLQTQLDGFQAMVQNGLDDVTANVERLTTIVQQHVQAQSRQGKKCPCEASLETIGLQVQELQQLLQQKSVTLQQIHTPMTFAPQLPHPQFQQFAHFQHHQLQQLLPPEQQQVLQCEDECQDEQGHIDHALFFSQDSDDA
eukprot:m.107665 g.107665  ORF g.107665 m.107665 type:complete len:342 (+) comp13330_c0_seq2:226-1251(+)